MNRFKIVKSMLMNLPVSLTMGFVAQAVNIHLGHMRHFVWGSIAISLCFSCFIVSLLTQRPALRLAKKICGSHSSYNIEGEAWLRNRAKNFSP